MAIKRGAGRGHSQNISTSANRKIMKNIGRCSVKKPPGARSTIHGEGRGPTRDHCMVRGRCLVCSEGCGGIQQGGNF